MTTYHFQIDYLKEPHGIQDSGHMLVDPDNIPKVKEFLVDNGMNYTTKSKHYWFTIFYRTTLTVNCQLIYHFWMNHDHPSFIQWLKSSHHEIGDTRMIHTDWLRSFLDIWASMMWVIRFHQLSRIVFRKSHQHPFVLQA